MGLGSGGSVGSSTSRGVRTQGRGSGAESERACLENKKRRLDPVFSVVPRIGLRVMTEFALDDFSVFIEFELTCM